HLLRSAFELSERNDTPIMHEHLRLMQGENLIHGIMNDVKLFGKNNAFTLLQDRIGEANQKGFEIPPDDQLKVELQRRLTELYAKA
ncbi:MAG: hypothetical protein ABIR91_03310, partial [Candidatus Saccharimonadales bacterium]